MPAYRDHRDGRWRYRIRILAPNGKKVRITGTPAIDTQKAAEHAERQHIFRVQNPGLVQPVEPAASKHKEVPLFREYATEFLASYKPERGLDTANTKRQRKQAVLDLVRHLGHLRLDEITQQHVNEYKRACEREGLTSKTACNRLVYLHTTLAYAAQHKLVPEPDLHCSVTVIEPEPQAVALADVPKLVAAAPDLRYQFIVLAAAEAGLRGGEIRAAQWGDVQGKQLTVRRSATGSSVNMPKHGKKRVVPLSPALCELLRVMPRTAIWIVPAADGGMLGLKELMATVNAMYRQAEVPVPTYESGRAQPLHGLRHCYATTMVATGVPIPVLAKLLGHASIKTTMRYVSVADSQLVEAVEQAFGQRPGNEPMRSARSPTEIRTVERR